MSFLTYIQKTNISRQKFWVPEEKFLSVQKKAQYFFAIKVL